MEGEYSSGNEESHCDLCPYYRHRAFTAPDGREYVWKMGMWTSEVCLRLLTKLLTAC